MLLSMTGFGEARFHDEQLSLSIEVRAVNNRHLKVMLRASDPYHLLEAEVEKTIRRRIHRGTIQVHLRLEKQSSPQDFRINPVALRSYVEQIQQAMHTSSSVQDVDALFAGVLTLPGVVPEASTTAHDLDEIWPTVESTLVDALDRLDVMRQEEGRAMAEQLLCHQQSIVEQLAQIRLHAPGVADAYRERLHDRVNNLLAELDIEVDRNSLIREVAIFADRSDIAEETLRLGSHLDQFRDMINSSENPGKKLEFLTQEMFREANTIGSKASDVEISKHVVEIKGTLERIRELVQNVE